MTKFEQQKRTAVHQESVWYIKKVVMHMHAYVIVCVCVAFLFS